MALWYMMPLMNILVINKVAGYQVRFSDEDVIPYLKFSFKNVIIIIES